MAYLDLCFTLISGASVAMTFGYVTFFLRKSGNNIKPSSNDIRKLERQLPPFLDSISSNLAVGNSLQKSIESVSQKTQASLGTFFEEILLRVRSGMTLDISLELQARELPGGSLALALLSMASAYRSGSNMIGLCLF